MIRRAIPPRIIPIRAGVLRPFFSHKLNELSQSSFDVVHNEVPLKLQVFKSLLNCGILPVTLLLAKLLIYFYCILFKSIIIICCIIFNNFLNNYLYLFLNKFFNY